MHNRNIKSRNHHVNRDNQISQIREHINTIKTRGQIFDSVLCWYGVPGIGKTTLGYMIADLCAKMSAYFVRLDFNREENKQADQYAKETISILRDLVLGLDEPDSKEFQNALKEYQNTDKASLRYERRQKVVSAFNDYIREILKKGPVMILFDTTEQASEEVIDWLEESIISPLCINGRCIIVWNGRFNQRWKHFEIRRRATSQKLDPLLPDATIEQIGPDGESVHRLTSGHPMGNRELASVIRDFRENGKQADQYHLVNHLMNQVIDKYVMKDVAKELNMACRMLSVVRVFDVVMCRRILSEFVDGFTGNNSYLKVLGDLTDTSLVEWDNIRKGYALDIAIRRILSIHLRLNAPKKFTMVNKLASEIYEGWIEKMSGNREKYILERIYHEAKIQEMQTLSTPVIIIDKMKTYLKRYYTNDDAESNIALITQLYEEFCRDDELKDILGDNNYSGINDIIKNHRRQYEIG